MDNSIVDMYSKGYIDKEEAIVKSTNPGKMEKVLASVTISQPEEEVVQTV